MNEYDSYFKATALLFIKYQQASISTIQRKFKIECNRAYRIFDQLEAQGIVKSSMCLRRDPHTFLVKPEPYTLLVKDEAALDELLKNKDIGEQILESLLWNSDL